MNSTVLIAATPTKIVARFGRGEGEGKVTDLVQYPTDVLRAVYYTHRYTALDKLVNRLEDGYRRFYGQDVVLAVKVDLWDKSGRQISLYQQERQVLRAIYVLAHQQNDTIIRFTPAELMKVLGYARIDGKIFSPAQRERVLRALRNLFETHVEVEIKLGSGGTRKLYGHFLDSYAVDTDRNGRILRYDVQLNVLIGLDLSRFKLMPANLPKLVTRHGPDQAVTTFVDFCLLWEGQTVAWSLETWVRQLQLDAARRTRNQHIIARCAQWGMDNGLVLSWEKGRLRQDKRRVKYTMVIAPQRYRGQRLDEPSGPERFRTLVEHFYTLLGTKASEQKLTHDAAICARLLEEGFSVDDVTFAVEWAVHHLQGVTSFGLVPHIMHQALLAKRDARAAENAKQEAEARIQAQIRQQREEHEREQRLEAFRASLSEQALQTFRRQAEDALAVEGVQQRQLGYSILRKIRMDDLMEQQLLRADDTSNA